MTIAYQDAQMFGSPKKWLVGTLVKSVRAGYSLLVLPSGRVFSMQPGGVYGDRDPGTDGPWEQLKVSGNVLAFNPNDEPFGVVFMAL